MATTVTGMDSVIATGMGQIDYLASGSNKPELAFTNQQNFFSTTSDLELRGTDTPNTLYASSGEDILEGRGGNDNLSGGSDNDDFVFDLSATDAVDVIHRQTDANGDNIWDKTAAGVGLYGRDFGLDQSSTTGTSVLQISVTKAGGNAPGDELDDVVNFVTEITTGVKVNGAFVPVTLNTAAIKPRQPTRVDRRHQRSHRRDAQWRRVAQPCRPMATPSSSPTRSVVNWPTPRVKWPVPVWW
ncbi:MAG: hypothetical protein IPO19_14075 [Rhodoferax sp.]|nr:hypothetical protein [Rhodoferax sp.]